MRPPEFEEICRVPSPRLPLLPSIMLVHTRRLGRLAAGAPLMSSTLGRSTLVVTRRSGAVRHAAVPHSPLARRRRGLVHDVGFTGGERPSAGSSYDDGINVA